MIIPHNTNLLITGAPRSGTYFTTRLLYNLGLNIKHEKTDTHGTVSCLHLINPTGFTKIVHQVREPLKSICSLHKVDWLSKQLWLDQKDDENFSGHFEVNLSAKKVGKVSEIRETSWRYFLNNIKDKNLTRKCMKAYLSWNKLAMEVSEFTYKIEDVLDTKESFDSWITSLGLVPEKSDYEYSMRFIKDEDISNSDLTKGDSFGSVAGLTVAPDLSWEILESLDSGLCGEIKELTGSFYS
tara:strand:+ start:10 stop:729 length:720 start_codon:yes stop_codon:yes gene_type:complete